MCILLKLDHAKFGVSNLFSSKVVEEKHLGVSARPPNGKGRANGISRSCALISTYSIKQPDLYYFETIKMTSQA